MSEPDRGQRIAEYLLANQITIVESDDGRGISEYTFYRKIPLKGLDEIGIIRYDGINRRLLPSDSEEMQRRLRTPGFLANVTMPFSRLLAAEQGDFLEGPGFAPIHTAIDSLE